jgi:hypothetical protein
VPRAHEIGQHRWKPPVCNDESGRDAAVMHSYIFFNPSQSTTSERAYACLTGSVPRQSHP